MPVKYSQSLEINQPYFLVGGKSEQRSSGGGACVLFSSAVAFAEAHRYTCVWLSSFRWLSSSTVQCIRQASSLQRLSKPTLQLTSALKKSGQCRQVSRRCGVFDTSRQARRSAQTPAWVRRRSTILATLCTFFYCVPQGHISPTVCAIRAADNNTYKCYPPRRQGEVPYAEAY
jgi:hypothetical protein